MDIIDLKIIYSSLQDLEMCRKFLKSFYSEHKSKRRDVLISPLKPQKLEPARQCHNFHEQ
jgi:hypothetical protein